MNSITVWYLIVHAYGHVAPVQLGPYSDVESCNRVAEMTRADGKTLLNEPRGCVQVNIPVLPLLVKQ